MIRSVLFLFVGLALSTDVALAQNTELPAIEKVRNYLPHMTRPEVEDLLTRSDMVIIPVGSLEQHGTQLPMGTDYLNGQERANLIAQRADVLVAPILLQMEVAPGVLMSPVWLGVMMAVNLQTSFLTPPFGVALFYLRGVAPPGVRTTTTAGE